MDVMYMTSRTRISGYLPTRDRNTVLDSRVFIFTGSICSTQTERLCRGSSILELHNPRSFIEECSPRPLVAIPTISARAIAVLIAVRKRCTAKEAERPRAACEKHAALASEVNRDCFALSKHLRPYNYLDEQKEQTVGEATHSRARLVP